MTLRKSRRLYLIPVLSKALDILELLQAENQPMTLEAIHRQTKISKTTAYRVLKTFVHRGYLVQSSDGLYRHVTRPKKLCFGFGQLSAEMPFSVEVTESLKEAASAVGVDLMVLDNCYDPATAMRNAEEFVKHRVDLVIEFQVEQEAAPVIADKIAAAKIPLIAIDIPHPHATFFGVDNYRVGFEAGELLAAHALRAWGGKVDWTLGLDLPEAGLLVQSRITGVFEAVRSAIPDLPVESFVRIDGRGMRDRCRKLISDFLERHPRDRRILISANSDTAALGAVDAVRDKKRERHVAIVGQDCIPEAVDEMRKPSSPFIGSVSHEAGSYGPSIIHLGLALLRGQTVAPYNYVAHKMVTPQSLASFPPAN
ncbi:MAG: substrate-binding domain-containing protein [Acidobacteriaceae bacterium]|jgi:ribose transport system substrate-binding protein